jgi:hypothetical protein
MSKQPVIAQKPRPTTTKFIHASRHFILNPENRVRHDLSLKEAGKRASEVMAKVALAKAKGLAKIPAKIPPAAKKGQDISSQQLAAHVKTMSRDSPQGLSFIKK